METIFYQRPCFFIQAEEEENTAPVQTLFTVKLEKFDESKKIALIKEVKKLLEGMNLVQVCFILFSLGLYG